MQPAASGGELSDVDRARADAYALISRLFYAPPDAALLGALAGGSGAAREAGAQSPESAYAEAYRALQQASRESDADALRQEYDDLFVGAGKAAVTPYTSGYAVPHAPDRHLLALREQLAAWGLARREAVFELEDHVSAVCDVMRWLIARGRPGADQRAFFDDFVYAGVGAFCNAIEQSPASAFYRALAQLTRALLAVEREAFDVHLSE